MYKGDVQYLGGQGLGGLQKAIDNTARHLGEVGARQNRMEQVEKRLIIEDRNARERLDRVENIDFEESIMNLQMLQLIQQASLKVGARILQPTLLDFIK